MNEHLMNEFDPKNFFPRFFRTSKAILLSPKVFFQEMRRDGGFLNPFLYLLSCIVFHVLIFGLLQKNPLFMLRTLILGLIFPLITAGILLLIITKVFKASGSYETVFRINAYASAVNLLSWLPLIGLLFEFLPYLPYCYRVKRCLFNQDDTRILGYRDDHCDLHHCCRCDQSFLQGDRDEYK